MYFSVKRPLKILGKSYIPCICYEVNKVLEATVNKMVAEGKAVIYTEKVGFMNGKVLEVKAVKKSKKTAKKEEKKVEEPAEKAEIKLEENTETGF